MEQNNQWCFPPELRILPVIEAEPWVKICDRAMCLEGPVFDEKGNLYLCQAEPFPEPVSRIVKVSPSGEKSLFCDLSGKGMCLGLARHPDGRFFGAGMDGGIFILSPGGELLRQIETVWPNGEKAVPNDCVLDRFGDLWFSDYRGYAGYECGALVRMRARDNYETMERVVGKLCCPNGLAFSADERILWLAESNRNAVLQIRLDPEGELACMGEIVNYVYYNSGLPMPDGCTCGRENYLYQAIMRGGRILVLDELGMPVGSVLMPGRAWCGYNNTSNLCRKPGTNEIYVTASGSEGGWVLRFDTEKAPWNCLNNGRK